MAFLQPFNVTTQTAQPQSQTTAAAPNAKNALQLNGETRSFSIEDNKGAAPAAPAPVPATASVMGSVQSKSAVPASYVSSFAADAASSRHPPQLQPFSQSTQDILSRIGKSHTLSSGSPEWEAARRQVLESMAGNTYGNTTTPPATDNLVAPKRGRGRGRPPLQRTLEARAAAAAAANASGASTPPATTPARRGNFRGGRPRGRGGRGGRRGTKRKRDDDEDGDDSSSLSSAESSNGGLATPKEPLITKSGRSINKPSQFMPTPKLDSPSNTPSKRSKKLNRRVSEAAVCAKCLRGHSTASNVIVFCDGCNTPWHQWCHDPAIERDVVDLPEKEWFCGLCEAEKEDARLPMDKRVAAGELSIEEREAYLDTLPRPTLAKLLLRVTSKHADFPMFAPNTREMLNTRARRQNEGKVVPGLNGHVDDSDPYPDFALAAQTNDPPSTYPRPGNGPIRPRPTTNREDMEWLLEDDTGFENFSHYYDPGIGSGAPSNLVPVSIGSNGTKGSWIVHAQPQSASNQV